MLNDAQEKIYAVSWLFRTVEQPEATGRPQHVEIRVHCTTRFVHFYPTIMRDTDSVRIQIDFPYAGRNPDLCSECRLNIQLG